MKQPKKTKTICLKPSENILLWIFIVCILFLSFLVIRPILKPIISGLLLGYLLYPLYELILKQKRINISSRVAAYLIIMLIVLFLIIPLLLMILLLALNRDSIISFSNFIPVEVIFC